jgi:hypothetical protein
MQSWGVNSADSVAQYGARAEREMEYFPLKTKSQAVQRFFHQVETLWIVHFPEYVWITSVLIVIAWIGAFLSALCWVMPRTRFCRVVKGTGVDRVMPPVIAASALLLYEDLATAMFSQPVYRYFHITEPLRLVIAGFGIVFVTGALSSVWRRRIAEIGESLAQPRRKGVVSIIQKYDLLDGYFGHRRAQWIFWLVVVNASLFAWWASNMTAHTT